MKNIIIPVNISPDIMIAFAFQNPYYNFCFVISFKFYFNPIFDNRAIENAAIAITRPRTAMSGK